VDLSFAKWHATRHQRSSPRAIGLFGLFGCGNSGNDGSLAAMLIFLRQVVPGADLACISTASDKVAEKHGLAPITIGGGRPSNVMLRAVDALLLGAPHKLASLLRAVRHVRKFDVLLIPGTGILDDFGERPSGVPATLFGWCLAARLCGTRIAFVSIGAGPIHHPLSRWLMKSAAGMAHYRSYRDTVSKAYMQGIGFDTSNDGIYPDLAFKLPAPPSPRSTTQDALTVAVGVMGYYGWHNDGEPGRAIYAAYIKKIQRFVLWLLDQGHGVRILMGDEVDWQAVADVVTNVASARQELPEDCLRTAPMGSLHDLMRQIAETDLVVATRFHNIVCALKLGKPAISIGYAAKNDALMAEMGLGEFCQHIESFDVDVLIEQVTRFIAGRRDYEVRIREVNLLYQEQLAEQDSLLATQILMVGSATGTATTREHNR
jgi:polysaccharide pyruvyl transferase WcaK-like protein